MTDRSSGHIANPSRRDMVALLAATGASALLPSGLAQAQATRPYRIDTHNHLYPPRFVQEFLDRLVADAPAFPKSTYTDWTPAISIEDMDKNNIATAMVSVTSPGIWTGDVQKARTMARLCNEYGATMRRDYPGRFGMFATIAPPDRDGSLREIEYAFDVLKHEGICLMSSYDGKLLGDKSFIPVFDELNRRKAVVFVHPTSNTCCGQPSEFVTNPIIEFPVDTTRTLTSLILSGTTNRCRDIKFIFPHGGGVLPMLAARIINARHLVAPDELKQRVPKGITYELQQFYYDIASATSPSSWAAFRTLVQPNHMLLGTDVPFFKAAATVGGLGRLNLPDTDLKMIERDNALALLPGLSKT